MASKSQSPLAKRGGDAEWEYVKRMGLFFEYFGQASQDVWQQANEWWDLFLAKQQDKRDPVDEDWRSDIFVPEPFITTRTKAAQLTELLGNSEPVWQVEATSEAGEWYEQSKHYERLLDYVHRMNSWRKFLYKAGVHRSVQGTAIIKVVWVKRAHTVTFFPSKAEEARFIQLVAGAQAAGAPAPPDRFADPGGFEAWRQKINMVADQRGWKAIPAPDESGGPREIIEYEGPVFQLVPLWRFRMDPMIDEIRDQKVIIHHMVKPLSYVLTRASAGGREPGKPYDLDAVNDALGGWDGSALESGERDLATKMGLNPAPESHPYLEKAVELWEVWSQEEDFKYSLIMNHKRVINPNPFERPLLTMVPNIFLLRNIIVPGYAYGLSDYQEPHKLFRELNDFRRLRMDGATLTTLPVFVKNAGVSLTEAMKKLRPGMVLSIPGGANGIQSLIKHTLPPEAYREPVEIKQEIEEATEVYSSTKGAPATVGRVTGVEYQGRAGNVLLKYKVDASIVEDELLMLPAVILSFFAQMGPDRIDRMVGGDPSTRIDVTRSQVIEALNMRFRFRGATKHIQPDLQVQQLTQALTQFKDDLTPTERRFALQLVLEMLDIRGYSRILSSTGGQATQQTADAQIAAGTAAAQLATAQAQAALTPAPVVTPPPSELSTGGAADELSAAADERRRVHNSGVTINIKTQGKSEGTSAGPASGPGPSAGPAGGGGSSSAGG